MQYIKVLISAVEKLFERFPLNSLVVRMRTCILRNSLAQSAHEANRNQLKNLLHHIISCGILTPYFSDKVINQFSKFLTTECTTNWDIFIGYDQSNKLLDDFYFKNINRGKSPDLASVLKLVLTLSYGQASVERRFSVNKAIMTNNISTDSIVWKHLVRDCMLTNNLKPHTPQIISNSKVAFKSACQKYQPTLKAEKSNKEKQGVEDQKAIILSEIEDVKSHDARERVCAMLMFLQYFFFENLQVSTFVCFAIYLVLKVHIFFLV